MKDKKQSIIIVTHGIFWVIFLSLAATRAFIPVTQIIFLYAKMLSLALGAATMIWAIHALARAGEPMPARRLVPASYSGLFFAFSSISILERVINFEISRLMIMFGIIGLIILFAIYLIAIVLSISNKDR